MKLISFLHNGTASYGIVQGDQVADIGSTLREQFHDLKSLLAGDGLPAAEAASGQASTLPLTGLHLLPVIPNPAKIFCVGRNYEDHRAEMGADKTSHPSIFTRFADSQTAHDQPALIPRLSTKVDFEGELAVVIGRGGRYIPAEDALQHVAGYACFNDISIRDWQRHTTQFTPGKNFPSTGGFGPWLVTADEITDPQQLELTTRINGETVQRGNTADMTFPIREIIAYLSSFTPLSPGDVIATGTPGGVGEKRNPPLFLKAGDTVEVEISSIGILRNVARAE